MPMTQTTNEQTVKPTGWWAIPERRQQELLAMRPDKDEWTFVATRVSDAAWSIDVPEMETYGELLVGGTNEALDEHYLEIVGVDAVDGDQLVVTCSTKAISDMTTAFHLLRKDKAWEGAGYYQDAVLGQEAWVCPFPIALWGYQPKTIHIRLTPLPA